MTTIWKPDLKKLRELAAQEEAAEEAYAEAEAETEVEAEANDAVSVCVCMGSMDERAKSLGRIQPPVRSWLGGYISPRMARG